MRYPILSLVVLLTGSVPSLFAGGKTVDLGRIQVENATPFGISVTIEQGDDSLASYVSLEPEESVVVRPQSHKGESTPEDVVIQAFGLEYPGQGLVRTRTVAGDKLPGKDGCDRFEVTFNYSMEDINIEDVDSPCSAAVIREARVLVCSSAGLLVLGCVGYRLGRTPRS